jgi:hypothetical protein
MLTDKTTRNAESYLKAIEAVRNMRVAGSITHFQYASHVTRMPKDFCPFECQVCDALRGIEAPPATATDEATPLS